MYYGGVERAGKLTEQRSEGGRADTRQWRGEWWHKEASL